MNIKSKDITLAQVLENSRLISTFVGILIIFYFLYFLKKGFSLDLNIVSWSFLGLGLILSSSSIHYVKLVNNAAITVGPIILQYPFYLWNYGNHDRYRSY